MTGLARHLQISALAVGLAAILSACSSSEANKPVVADDTVASASAAADRAAEAADRAAAAAQRAEDAAAAAAEAAEKSDRIAQRGLRK